MRKQKSKMKQRIKDKKIKRNDIIAGRSLTASIISATYDNSLIMFDNIGNLIMPCFGYYLNDRRKIRRIIRSGKSLRRVFVQYMVFHA